MCSHTYTWISAPPLFLLNKYIKNSLKFFKQINLLYKHSPTWKLHKINADNALYWIKIFWNCIKIRKNESPKKTSKCVKNLTSKWNQKQQHFFPHASRSLIYIRFVAVGFWSEEEVCWIRDPRDLFWPRPGSAPGRIWPINKNTCKGPWVLHA